MIKKTFILFLLFLSIFLLSGCEKKEHNGDFVIAINEVGNLVRLHQVNYYIEYKDSYCIVNNNDEEVCWEKTKVDIYKLK